MVDFPVSGPATGEPFPWRAAALAASAIAAVELVLLVLVGGTLIVKPDGGPARAKAAPASAAKTPPQTPSSATKAAPSSSATPTGAALPRRKVKVMILNGNGRTGAAAAASASVRSRGYRVGVVGNAPRQDYPRSIVMYRRGFAAEAARLAHDLRIGLVSPLDGMRPRQLAGAHAVVILGA